MNILILNGSPRARGETAGMIEVFQQAAVRGRASCAARCPAR